MKQEDPVPLPEARVGRERPSRLKDPVFLNELGAVLAFFGLFLTLCVAAQRGGGALEKDPFAANVMLVLVFVTFSASIGSGVMAVERLLTGGERPRSFIRHLGAMSAGVAVSVAVVVLLANVITRLILPLQMFLAWLGMSAGLTLLFMTRKKAKGG